MFRDKKLLKAGLSQFSRKELEDMVIKLAGKRHNFEFLLINYFDREGGEQWLFGEALDGLERIFEKEYKGRSIQHREVKRLNASAKLIKDFAVEVKNKKYEADLMMHVLRREFAFPDEMFGAGFSLFDYKLALWVKRLLQIHILNSLLLWQEDIEIQIIILALAKFYLFLIFWLKPIFSICHFN